MEKKEMLLKEKKLRLFHYLVAVFSLFQKGSIPEKTTDSTTQLDDEAPDFSRIRCPLCQWQPTALSRWCCANCKHPEHFFNACGTVWNTFSTAGQCPGCGHQWRWTACLYCGGWSLHEAWYTKKTD
ncbi:MAG: hypothetical protein AB1489_38170 [Acidobacteriota bacterium]